jgi:hypothetical protein
VSVGHRVGYRYGLAAMLFLIAIATPMAASSVGATSKVGHWSGGTDLGLGAASAISCASTKFCEAIGVTTGTDTATTFNGKWWSSPATVAQYSGIVTSLSCPVDGWCAAITDLAEVTILRYGRWSKLATIDPNPGPPYPGMVTSLSCTSSTFCVAVDAQGMSEIYDGSSWTNPRLTDQDYPLNDVSCGAWERCVAVDGLGRVLSFDDGRWSTPVVIDDTALTGVSCASETACIAVDLLGRALVFRAGRWGRPSSIDQSSAAPLSVFCPAAGSCVVADVSGRVLTLADGRWSGAEQIDNSDGAQGSLVAVACVHGSGGPCFAVDSFGDALENQDPFGGH